MFRRQVTLATLAAIGICVGSSVALSNRTWFAGASAAETKIDFNQVFDDAAWRGRPKPLAVNREKKSDRLPVRKVILPERARLPFCEPLAAPYSDAVLGRIVGRCSV